MKYTPATIAKALVAFGVATVGAATTAAGGPDLSVLDLPQWIAAFGAGLVAGAAVFATPNKDANPALSPSEQIGSAIQVQVQRATDEAAELERVKKAAADALGNVPILGPLATQVINSLPKLP